MNNRICEILDIEKPVIQAPMVWLTDAKLCAAACNAGGMGSLGPNAGQTTVTRDPVETAERMREEIRKVRELTDKPFNVNILPPYGDTEDIFTPPMLKVIYEEKVPVVTYVGGIRPELFAELKEHDIKIIFRSLNPDPDEAREAVKYGADIIVATGFDEGGTLPDMTLGTFSIVPLMVDAVDVPVMAAGGIYDSRTFNAVMALGAEGAYCGTAFLMSEESRMAENVKQAVIKKPNYSVVPDSGFETNKCPILYALSIVGQKWKLPILWYLYQDKTIRYNELKRRMSGITNVMLTKSLKELEESGLIIRKQYSEIPPKVKYSLTDRGEALIPALNALYEWGEEQMKLNLSEE